jgi:hypothetical protein
VLRTVAATLIALTLAGCAGGSADVPDAGLSRAELDWLGRFAAWGEELGDAQTDAQDAHEQGVLAGGDPTSFVQALRRLRACEDSLDRDVPDPPTERLREVADMLARACGSYRRYADAQAAALRGNPGAALLRAAQAGADADELLLRVYARLGGLLRDNRPLPRRRGGEDSRIDPLYSRIGTRIAYERVEVRCWSESEWRDVIRERSAFSNGYLNVHETLGFAWPEDRRAHLSPRICADLDGLSLRRERPSGGAAQRRIATAVVVLVHEIVHLRAESAAEGEVECRAIQEARGAAQSLGADADYAAELVELYWDEVYGENDRVYYDAECRPGGYLDLDPADPRWP